MTAALQSWLLSPDVGIVLVGAFVGVASSLVGTFLVLRKSSMLSDAISHAILLGIVLVYLITGNQYSPFFLVGSALAGVATVALSELLARSRRVKSDAAIGLVYPLLFAVAVVLINVYARDVHIDAHAVLLGEIGFVWLDTTVVGGLELPSSLLNIGIITLVNLLFIVVFYKELKLTSFDPALAAALGFAPGVLYYALLGLTSLTAVTAFDAVGAVLLVAFVIIPPSTAYLLTDKLWRMLLYGAGVGVGSSLLGYPLALALDVSIGGMMACVAGLFLVVAFLVSPRYGLIAQEIRRHQQQRKNARRMLLVHLYSHENDRESLEENAVTAMQTHLRWSPERAREVLMDSLEEQLVEKHRPDDRLTLTSKGRILAQEVLEPWRRGG
ncbi:MAG: metal ABC transporter permease [Trueperaceae bacterium]|nr:metal ABC transporter permease [Trueperaceae bacterium]